MSTFSILDEMLNSSVIINTDNDHNNRKKVELREPQCPQSFVIVRGLPNLSRVVKIDNFEAPQSFFRGTKGECKRADYMIITEKDSQLFVVVIEMKASTSSKIETIKQLKGANCIFQYIQAVGTSFWQDASFLNQCQLRFVKICHTTLNKRPTRSKKERGYHKTPEKMLKIAHTQHLQFNHLLGLGQTND